MRIQKLAIGLIATLSLLLAPGFAAHTATAPPVHECDRLAAHPDDPNAVVEGVEFGEITVENAIAECSAALRAFPGAPRFEFQLGRAFDAAERMEVALPHYRAAAELGYAQAQYNLGLSYWEGTGTERNEQEAHRPVEAVAQLQPDIAAHGG